MAHVAAGLLLLGALACASREPVYAQGVYGPGLSEAGRGWYVTYCAACHGADGRGEGPVAGALARDPSDLTRLAERNAGVFDGGSVAAFIDGRRPLDVHGSREMPVWGRRFDDRGSTIAEETRLGPGAILLIVEHLRTIQVTDPLD